MRMNQKSRLALAAGVVAAMVALVTIFGYHDQHAPAWQTQERWLPELATRLAQVNKVRLRSGASVVTLVREGEHWGIEERDGFPADFRQLQTLLDALASARLIERKTSQPEYLGRLGLVDIERLDTDAVQVEVWAGGDEPIVRVLIGNSGGARGGRFVRAANEQQAWLIDTAPQPLAEPADWIERRLLGVAFTRVATVERELGGQQEFLATRNTSGDDASLNAQSLPAGKAPRYISVFDAAARSILTMEPEDVRKATEGDYADAVLTRITCFDGLQIEARAHKAADGNWMTLAVRVDATRVPPDAPEDSAAKPATEPTQSPLAVREEAARLAQRIDGWAFKVSDYVAGEATKPLADYIQDERPAAKPADGAHNR